MLAHLTTLIILFDLCADWQDEQEVCDARWREENSGEDLHSSAVCRGHLPHQLWLQ